MNKDLDQVFPDLHLAKDMFISNDFMLPMASEVIEEVLNKYDKNASFEYGSDINVATTEKNK